MQTRALRRARLGRLPASSSTSCLQMHRRPKCCGWGLRRSALNIAPTRGKCSTSCQQMNRNPKCWDTQEVVRKVAQNPRLMRAQWLTMMPGEILRWLDQATLLIRAQWLTIMPGGRVLRWLDQAKLSSKNVKGGGCALHQNFQRCMYSKFNLWGILMLSSSINFSAIFLFSRNTTTHSTPPPNHPRMALVTCRFSAKPWQHSALTSSTTCGKACRWLGATAKTRRRL
mmetsp:Transcript_63847/g.119785  ORF Transcript_63847/g.119785 Transcript_63847/m.119785 type:complete len:227 (-) Transcript_63847:5732-6412(-)